MNGMDRNTGKRLSGIEHLRQSVVDILTTPLGSRVMRRTYGSRLFELLDSPLNASTQVQFFAATAQALATWEPRLKVLRVQASYDGPRVSITLTSRYLPTGEEIELDGIVL